MLGLTLSSNLIFSSIPSARSSRNSLTGRGFVGVAGRGMAFVFFGGFLGGMVFGVKCLERLIQVWYCGESCQLSGRVGLRARRLIELIGAWLKIQKSWKYIDQGQISLHLDTSHRRLSMVQVMG